MTTARSIVVFTDLIWSHSESMNPKTGNSIDPPELVVRWFKATNNPVAEHQLNEKAEKEASFGLAMEEDIDEDSSSNSTSVDYASINTGTKLSKSTKDEIEKVRKVVEQNSSIRFTTSSSLPSSSSKPTQWVGFSDEDSNELENTHQKVKSILKSKSFTNKSYRKLAKENGIGDKVLVGKDCMFEVDMPTRIIYPIYWDGPIYRVIRAKWFKVDIGAKTFSPLEENLAEQIETGYKTYKPWEYFEADKISEGESSSEILSEEGDLSQISKPSSLEQYQTLHEKFKWPLYDEPPGNTESEPENKAQKTSQYAVFSSTHEAWLLKQDVASKLAQAFLLRISNGGNWGGIKLVRGYQQVKKLLDKDVSAEEKSEEEESQQSQIKAKKERKIPKIKHVIFATHGIGQKMGGIFNFVEDTNVLRKLFFDCCDKGLVADFNSEFPDKKKGVETFESLLDYGIMVLPVEWRKGMAFDRDNKPPPPMKDNSDSASRDNGHNMTDESREKSLPSVRDITVDGIPAVRKILSDACLDILLYMEPVHRADMLNQFLTRTNMLFDLFMERNPSFIEDGGKFHFFAHSLGTLIAFDSVCWASVSRKKILSDETDALVSERSKAIEEHSPIDLSELSYFESKSPIDTSSSQESSELPLKNQNHSLNALNLKISSSYNKINKPISESEGDHTHHSAYFKNGQYFPQGSPLFLKFPVEKLFLTGSPLGMFSLLKAKRIGVPLSVVLEYYEDWRKEVKQRIEKVIFKQNQQDDKMAALSPVISDLTGNLNPGIESLQHKSKHFEKELDKLMKSIWNVDNEYFFPDVGSLYTVYHPSDPISYKLEPMISKQLAEAPITYVPAARSAFASLTEAASKAKDDFTSKASGIFESMKNSLIASMAFQRSLDETTEDSLGELNLNDDKDTSSLESGSSNSSSLSSLKTLSNKLPEPKFTLEETLAALNPKKRRIDFSLQESALDIQYVKFLDAHFSYWKSEDCATFVMKEVLEIPDKK